MVVLDLDQHVDQHFLNWSYRKNGNSAEQNTMLSKTFDVSFKSGLQRNKLSSLTYQALQEMEQPPAAKK